MVTTDRPGHFRDPAPGAKHFLDVHVANVGHTNIICQDDCWTNQPPECGGEQQWGMWDALGHRLRELRKARGERQVDTAAAVNISRSHYTNIENGKDATGRDVLLALATHFNVPVDHLIKAQSDLWHFSENVGEAPAPALPAPPAEYDRLPEIMELLADQLAEQKITVGLKRLTVHAQRALREASRMDRRLQFDERARLAVEAVVIDLARKLD